MDRDGAILLEFAPIISTRNYDWSKKQVSPEPPHWLRAALLAISLSSMNMLLPQCENIMHACSWKVILVPVKRDTFRSQCNFDCL
jgi:hypothetical protein